MTSFGAHTAAILAALDELLLAYIPFANKDFTPYLACSRNDVTAIDKAFRFRMGFLRRLYGIKRTHGDRGISGRGASSTFHPAAEHLGSAVFGDRVFEATVANNAKGNGYYTCARATRWSQARAQAWTRGRSRVWAQK